MNDIENILATKLQYRLCRKSIHLLPSIQSIVKECCETLGIKKPTILFCESITKDFQAFDLKNKKFFIYDSGLMEILYLYNCIAFPYSLLTMYSKIQLSTIFVRLYVTPVLYFSL